MSGKAHPEDDVPNATFLHQEYSPTAATAGDDRYKPSGSMLYRVMVSTGLGFQYEDVEASSGDDAAEKALAKFPGCKVANVTPAPRQKAA